MRKITLAFLVVMVLVLALPAGIGWLAKTRHEALVGELAANLEGARLTESRYDGGWFTSRAQHRIRFDTPAYRELEHSLLGETGSGSAPELIIVSRIAHGPWPAKAERPAFMLVHSTLSLNSSTGELVEIPGEAVTRVGFAGAGQTRFVSPGLQRPLNLGRGMLAWDGADVTVVFDGIAQSLATAGTIGRLTLRSVDGELILGRVTLDGDSRRSEFGFWTGESRLEMDSIQIVTPDGSVVESRDLALASEISESEGLVDFRLRLDARGLSGGALSDATLAAAGSLTALDAGEWGRYLAIRQAGGNGAAVNFATLTRAGPVLRIETIDVTSPDGRLEADGQFSVPADSQTRGPLTALGAVAGGATVTVAPGLLAAIAQSGESLRDALTVAFALGYVRENEAGNYESELHVAGGLATINGLPMVLPR